MRNDVRAPSFITGALILAGLTLAGSSGAATVRTSVTTVAASTLTTQGDYRWYEGVDALTPVTPVEAQDAPAPSRPNNTLLRLRMNVMDGGLPIPAGSLFRLQFANAAAGPWTDVGTSTPWAYFDDPSVADGQIILNTLLSSSDIGESYGESNPSAAMPLGISPGEHGEWDWSLFSNGADGAKEWFFRMTNASGTAFDAYDNYPEILAAAIPQSQTAPNHVSVGGSTNGAPIPPPPLFTQPTLPTALEAADFNGDNVIDIVDLSIMLFYYGRGDQDALRFDLNGDGAVDFPDISILMYHWTTK